jgi:mono/diheme cytochrome c family protein
MKHALAWSGAVGLAIGLAIQFIPTARTNPPTTREVRWSSPATRALATRACFDCHSNDTAWPWYSRVAPASWLVINHVVDGRRHLNFSEWDKPQRATFTDVEDNVTRGDMPIWNYVMLHPLAKLTPAETAALVDGLRATLLHDPPIPRPGQR